MKTLNGEVECPMCDWHAGILTTSGFFESDARFLRGLLESHFDEHCERFAYEMDRVLPGVNY